MALASLPMSAFAASSETISVGTIVKVRNDVNVRSRPDANATLLGTADKNTKYAILDKDSGWYKVLYNGQTAYISAEYISVKKVKTKLSKDVTLKVGSFNVRALGNGTKADDVAKLLKNAKLDVVGLQEVDSLASRSGRKDWPKLLAEKAGYPYYYFSAAIGLGGGEYGTLILSKQPILAAETIRLSTSGGEARSMGYVQLMTSKGVVHMFNTHTSNGSESQKATCFRSIQEKIKDKGITAYFVTGDFNSSPNILKKYLGKGITAANDSHNTFGRGSAAKAIDNIVHTENVKVSNLKVTDAISGGISDHSLLTASVKIPRKK